MDLLSGATTFATLVSLIGQFIEFRADRSQRTIEEFRDWLRSQHQLEVVDVLEENTKTTIAVKELLLNDLEQITAKLDGLTSGLTLICGGIDGLSESLRKLETLRPVRGIGGAGGGGRIFGNGGLIIGGRGGTGGTSGIGGDGGSGEIRGDGGTIIGGDGGNAGTADGRGGRGAHGPTERLGFPSSLWGYGRGGPGANHPEYERRLALLIKIREEYLNRFPDRRRFIEAGVDQVPTDWINQCLSELDERWQIAEAVDGGYILPPLDRGR